MYRHEVNVQAFLTVKCFKKNQTHWLLDKPPVAEAFEPWEKALLKVVLIFYQAGFFFQDKVLQF